jgi:tetratricopeptide (TPR) repeat protein
MKKTVSLIVTALLAVQCLMAQVAEGIKFLNYEKYKSARETLKKAYEANPKDPQTIYWYGQSLIAAEAGELTKAMITSAKELYQKGLQEIGSDAWLLVGMGHLEILEGGDINSAKQKFEQAVTATTETRGRNKGKGNPGILTAIGRANADGGSKLGDPSYGIEKLKQAAPLDLTNPDIYITMGISYLKLGGENGGEAVKAYQEAIARDPKNARAMFRIGRIYQSQNNKELFDQFYGNAIAADPTYPPVYYNLYNYYADKDVPKAKEYLDKYVANADKDPNTDLFVADYLFRAGKYNESLEKVKQIESEVGGIDKMPKLYGIYAYNYDRTNDSVKAKESIEKFFATADAASLTPEYYGLAIKIYSRFPGSEDVAAGFIEKAMQLDTLAASRINYAKMASDMYAKAKNPQKQLVWLKKGVSFKKEMGITDYFYITDASIKAGELDEALRLSNEMISKFPDQIYGYRFAVQSAVAIDVDTTKGTAVPSIMQYIDFLKKDPAKNQRILPFQFYYLASYYHDKAKDYPKTLEVLNTLLSIYPEDKYGLQVKPIVEKEIAAAQKQQGTGGKTTTNPAASSGASGAGGNL